LLDLVTRSHLSAENKDHDGMLLDELRKLDAIIKKMTGAAYTAMQIKNTGDYSELRTALRSCISALEGFYSSIPA